MTSLVLFMVALNAMVAVVMLPRIYGDWLRFHQYRTNDDHEHLQELLLSEKQWVLRHFTCAVAAVIMVAILLKHRGGEQLAQATAAYAVFSSLLAVTESLFVQKLSGLKIGVRGNEKATRH